MTKDWYKAVLADMVPNTKLVDVGIGTGMALIKNRQLLQDKNISVIGIDYDSLYIKAAKNNMRKYKLDEDVKVHCKSIYDKNLVEELGSGFDCCYFSGSWSLMPDPVQAVVSASLLLKEDGQQLIYITQTFKQEVSFFMAIFKPLLRYLTTIDFGRATSVSKMESYLEELTGKNTSHGVCFKVERKEIIQTFYSTYLIKLRRL